MMTRKIVFNKAYIERQRRMLEKYREVDARIEKFLAALDEIERLQEIVTELEERNDQLFSM